MSSAVSPVDGLAGDYPREPRPALFLLRVGRISVVTVLDGLGERWGQDVESVGGLPVPAERAARPFQVKLPVYSPAGPFNPSKDGRRLRRQLRGLLENDSVRGEPVLWQWDADPEAAVWVVLGSGTLEDTVGGADVFADWTLSLDGAVRVGTVRSHRPARQLFARALASGAQPRDFKGLIVATDLAAANTLALHGLPAAGGHFTTQAGQLPPTARRSVRRGGNRATNKFGFVAVGQPSAAVIDFGLTPEDAGVGDVVAVDRRNLRETWAFGHSMTTGYSLPDTVRQRWPAIRATVRNRNVEQFYAVYGSACSLDSASGNGGYATMAQAFSVANRDPSSALMPVGMWEVILNWNIADLCYHGIEGAAAPANGNYTPFVRAMRYCVSRARSVAMCPINESAGASDAAFSWTGSWANNASTDKNSGTGWRSTTSGGFTWSSPGVIKPGQAVALNGLTIPGNHRLTVTATLVGAGETRTATFTVDGNAGQGWGNGSRYSSWCERFADLIGGDTYTLTVTTAGATGSGCGFDGVNVEFAEGAASQVLVFTTTRFPDGDPQYAAWFSSLPHQPTDAAITLADQRLRALVDEFGGAAAGVCMCDLGGQLGLDKASRVSDVVHANEWGQRRIERAAWEGAERSGEEMYGPGHERLMFGDVPGDAPVLENGLVRIRPYAGAATDPVPARATFAIDVPNGTYPYWDEIGRVVVCDQAANGGAWSAPYQVLFGSQLVSWSPERATMRVLLMRSLFDPSVFAEVFVTLERGQSQARFEVYHSSGPPGVAAGLGLAVRYVPNSTGVRAAASPLVGVVSGDPGVTWNNTNSIYDLAATLMVGAQPYVALIDTSWATPSVALAALRGNHYWRLVDDTVAYGGAARRAVQVEAPYGSTAAARGYCAATLGVVGGVPALLDATTVRNAGSGTTSAVADANSRSGTVVREAQTSDAAATLRIAPTGIQPQRQLALARISSTAAATTFSLYHKFTGTGGTQGPTTSSTPAASLSGALYVALGEATLGTAGGNWELHAWRTAGTGQINIDAVILVPTEMRQGSTAPYDGAADHCARAMLDHRTVPAITSKEA